MDTGIVDHWLFKPFSLTKLAGILNELVPTDFLRRFVGTRINVDQPESGMTMVGPEQAATCIAEGAPMIFLIRVIDDHWWNMTLFQWR
jgi:hypothetical protein